MPCSVCGASDLRLSEWWAPDDLWLHVIGHYEGALCAPCFDYKAKLKGWFLRWEPRPYPGIETPIQMSDANKLHDYLPALGRSMVLRAAAAEEECAILRRERDALLATLRATRSLS